MKNSTIYCLLLFLYLNSSVLAVKIDHSDSLKNNYNLSLEECLKFAHEFNNSLTSAEYGLEIAESQLGQANSAYYPTLDIEVLATIMDEDPIYLMEGFDLDIPPIIMGQLQLNIPTIHVPDQTQTLMDNKNLSASVNLLYPLYTGGKISSLVDQGKLGVEVAKEQIRKTNLQVNYDVSKLYFAAVLTRNLVQIATDALARMEATLELTESVYKNGSLKVTKIDYLKNKMFVENLRNILAQVEAKQAVVLAALKKEIGLKWDAELDIVEEQIPFSFNPLEKKILIEEALVSNPDLAMAEHGVNFLNYKIEEMESGHYPTVFLFGKFNQIFNSYDYGVVNKQNKTAFLLGLGVQFPIFRGFLISNQVEEAEARYNKMLEDRELYRDGITLKIQDLFFKITKAREQVKATEDAMNTAIENRELNERAYYADMVGVEDLIEAQIFESIMSANYNKTLFDHIEATFELDYFLGINKHNNN